MYTFFLSEFIRLSKFELERELPQTMDQSKVIDLVSRLWYRVSRVYCRTKNSFSLINIFPVNPKIYRN